LAEQPNRALTGTRPRGFIALRDVWLDVFSKLAADAGWIDLKGDQRPTPAGEPVNWERENAFARFQTEALNLIAGAIRREGGKPPLTVWTRQYPHLEPEVIDLHRMRDWHEYSIVSGSFVSENSRTGQPEFWKWPLFVQAAEWQAVRRQLFGEPASGPVSREAKLPLTAHDRRPKVDEAAYREWFEAWISHPPNRGATAHDIEQAAAAAFPDYRIPRELRRKVRGKQPPGRPPSQTR
jgi:hypothetical protein